MNTNSKHSLLLVDDEPDVLYSLKGLLRREFELFTAESGQQALQILREHPIQVIMTDQRMPGMTGIDLLKHVRADEKLADLPTLMVTAEAKRDQIVEAAQAGVNGYVVKPFTAQVLKEKIEKIFERVQ